MGGIEILRVEGIDTYYGAVQILHGLDLRLEAGELVSIIGPNGAGKSTALKAIFGLVPVAKGRVLFQGEDITHARPPVLVRKGMSFVPQGRAIFPSLTVSENLDMGGFIQPDRERVKQAKRDVYELFPLLRERRNQIASSLSGGEQQILAMGRALMTRPEVLLLDEPSVGLSPQMVDEVMDKVLEIRATGTAVMMVEQNAAMALELSDRAYVLVMGRNRLEGPGQRLLDDPKVQELYLGLG